MASVALSVSACGRKDRLIGRPDLTIVQQGVLPAPLREDLILQQRSYVIGPLDRVVVDVYGAPDLGRTVQVDASGTLALPLIGEVDAVGKTSSELARAIEDRLRGRYVRNPSVTVSVDAVNQVMTVDGQVARPGVYPVSGRMTLMRAVASASGVTEFADTNFVVVFRQVGAKKMAALYDLRAIREGRYADPEIYANDIVLVGEDGGERTFRALLQAGSILAAPLVAILN
ncbi:polysaccharide biosynthesis/export family protein [Sphingomonas sp.]|uniref:polysaccharide biosynthesis/export family protein n=1 Tax=Sphingomonas sp. TaxID=28214 RepID=UPI002ED99A1A